jgi:uncharacterized repeat protein (TIGR02543 family)
LSHRDESGRVFLVEEARDHFVRNGDVFVGWTSKSVTVKTLKAFNATRYAALDWPYVPFVPGGNRAVYDGITFDIAAQIGALFKDNGPASPTHDLNVERVFEAASPRTARSPLRRPRHSTRSIACPAVAQSTMATSPEVREGRAA